MKDKKNKKLNSYRLYDISAPIQTDHDCKTSLDTVPDEDAPKPWAINKIIGQTTITARIGPTGGKRGYEAQTGSPSWGLAWYLNDMLIPELYVERGETYLFIVEGGYKSDNQARYHPFYITDSAEGGLGQASDKDIQRVTNYAGTAIDSAGYIIPTAGNILGYTI